MAYSDKSRFEPFNRLWNDENLNSIMQRIAV
jgi:hypothetical protein